MKDAIVILVVTLLSLIFCERMATILPPFHTPINIESILDTQEQEEDNYAEIEFAIYSEISFPLSANEKRTLALTLSPSILSGLVSILWNPPK
jgi:hypothetical protein